jgi:hypothetical protein
MLKGTLTQGQLITEGARPPGDVSALALKTEEVDETQARVIGV